MTPASSTECRIIPFAHAVRRREARDPRPELSGDSRAWQALLAGAWDHDGRHPIGLFAALRELRHLGARLTPGEVGRVLLPPTEIALSDYADIRRRYLVPHHGTLCRLLRGLDGRATRVNAL